MNRYVISAPRSGLNWVRFCVEHFYGLRTPGQKMLIEKTGKQSNPFERSHDALGNSRGRFRNANAWQHFVPEERAGDKSLVILRDPAALFVRAYQNDLRQLYGFIGNVQYIGRCAGPVHVAYYDDLVASPEAMWTALAFLDFTPADGLSSPNLEMMQDQWDDLGAKSRGLYDVNQKAGGGSATKDNPTDFKFHQRKLSDKELALVWSVLEAELKPEELALLERFRPETKLTPPPSIQVALIRWRYWLKWKWKKMTHKG